jgi:hypothetical protein
LTDRNLDSEIFADSDSTLIDDTLDNDDFINNRNILINRMNSMEDSDLSDSVISNSDNNIYIDIDISAEENININKIDSDGFKDTEININNNLNLKSDIFSVTDKKFFLIMRKFE